MTLTTDETVPPVHPMEEFFAQAGQGPHGASVGVGPLASAASSGILLAVAGAPAGRPQPTPPEAPADVALPGDSEWLRGERNRLQAFTAQRFAMLRHAHESFLAERFKLEEEITRRSQEVSQQLAQLAAGREDLRRREEALVQREAAVNNVESRVASAEARFAELQVATGRLESDTAEARQQLERLTAEKAALEPAVREAQSALITLQEARAQGEKSWQAEQDGMDDRRRKIEEGHAALQKAEGDVARRQRELDEWDAVLRRECQQHEQQLAAERHELDEQRKKYQAEATLLESDPDLARLVNGWSTLPDYVKQTVRMLISAAK
jgi:DNA repair exonuclease SbcCD ATPase subunit